MKKLIICTCACVALVFTGLSCFGQNTHSYSGTVTYDGNQYAYETSCAGKKELMTGNIETYGLTIYKIKKDKKKQVLKTHCTALEVKRNHSDVKQNLDQIKFTTMNDKGLAPEVEGTSKKITLNFNFDNFMLVPQFGNNSPVGSADFDEGIKNMVVFILKAID